MICQVRWFYVASMKTWIAHRTVYVTFDLSCPMAHLCRDPMATWEGAYGLYPVTREWRRRFLLV